MQWYWENYIYPNFSFLSSLAGELHGRWRTPAAWSREHSWLLNCLLRPWVCHIGALVLPSGGWAVLFSELSLSFKYIGQIFWRRVKFFTCLGCSYISVWLVLHRAWCLGAQNVLSLTVQPWGSFITSVSVFKVVKWDKNKTNFMGSSREVQCGTWDRINAQKTVFLFPVSCSRSLFLSWKIVSPRRSCFWDS